MHYPRISIITPSFNQGSYLEQTIDSVLSQNYPNLEYMVIDGGSTDNSVEIIKKFSKHLTFWTSEEDNGQSHAINKGLSRSTGEIVNWINSDDYYEPRALKTVAEAFDDPKITMACFRANVFGLQSRISRGTDVFKNNLAKTIAYSRIDQPETFFRKSAIDQMGLLNESLHYCMDKEWLLRYLLHYGDCGISQNEEIILNFRYHDLSKSVSQRVGFEREADQIYLAYSKTINEETSYRTISQLLSGQDTKTIEIVVSHTDLLIHYGAAILHNYLFKRFREKYESLELELARDIASNIDVQHLDQKDTAILKRLHTRAKYLPKGVIRLLRNLRSSSFHPLRPSFKV